MSANLEGQSFVERWLEHLADGRELSPRTVEAYHDALLDFCRRMGTLEPERATLVVLDRYRFRLKNAGLALATRRIRLQGVVSFFRFLASRGLIAADPTLNFEIPQAKNFSPIPTFSGVEIERLLNCAPLPLVKGRREPVRLFAKRKIVTELAEVRDRALLALVYACGLRASEVSILDRDDYLGRYVHIRGAKAAKRVQTVEVMKRAQLEMSVYLQALAESPWASHIALFPPMHHRIDRIHQGSGLSIDAVAKVLRDRIARAGLDVGRRRLSPHVLRYSLATHLHECGYPPLEISRHLRHRTLQTLERYVSLNAVGLPKLRRLHVHPWIDGKAFTHDGE